MFKKLNILLRSSLNDRRSDSPPPLSRDAERDVAMLRRRINEALADEDELRARVQSLEAEVARWDAEADRFVAANNDASARYAVEQMQRAQQRLTMAASDLRDHQLVTQELIQRVNMLDAAVADARRAQAESDVPASTGLTDVLRDAGGTIATLGDTLASSREAAPPAETPVDGQAIEDDLESRRRRLSQ